MVAEKAGTTCFVSDSTLNYLGPGLRIKQRPASPQFCPNLAISGCCEKMPPRRPKPTKGPHSFKLAPAYVVAGLLAGSARSAKGLIPSASTTSYRWTASHGRGHQARRGVRCMRLSASGGKGVEDMDSSELYADIRHRLEVRLLFAWQVSSTVFASLF